MTESIPSGTAAHLVTGLVKLGLALRQEAWERTMPRGLTPTQAQALVCLRRAGLRRLGDLARELAVSEPTASEAVAVLVAKGLVSKRRCNEDGRALRLELTSAGRREAARASEWPDHFLEAAAELSAEEQRILLRSLMKIIRRLQQEGRIPIARMCATCHFFRPYVHKDARRPHHCDFVAADFGEAELRLECPDHEPLEASAAETTWRRFTSGSTP
jgi:DNA-binding MarR family transcriptional regulator